MALTAAFTKDDGTADEPGRDSLWTQWVAASDTFNFCSDDPLIDWLEAFGRPSGIAPDSEGDGYDPRTDFRLFVSDRAKEFESIATGYLAQRCQVVRIRDNSADIMARAAVESTWAAMCAWTEVIAQGVLWNPESRVFGSPDLLVRSDVLSRLFPQDLPAAASTATAADLPPGNAHYRVVDLKYTTLNLLKDGHAGADHLKYMAQVWLYNEALGRMQGHTPNAAFLLGRRWKDAKGRGTSAFERIARVDHEAYIKSLGMNLRTYATQACAWIQRVRQHGAQWHVLPIPSVPELWPNIRRTDDQPWHEAKLQIARQLEDLTLLPRVTPEKRTQSIAAGISKWTDTGCNSTALGITGGKLPAIVDAVIQANQSAADGPIVFPARVTANEALWRNAAGTEFYVDFETVSDLDDDFARFPEVNGLPLIFMIGCGHMTPGDRSQWNHHVFMADALTLAEERRVIEEWLTHMQAICDQHGTALHEARLFHWSPAETSTLTEAYNSAQIRQANPDWPELPWFDLLNRVVKEQPVTVRGAFGFGLKAVAKAMHSHGLIETLWDSGPTDGLGAMVGAWSCHREAARQTVPMSAIDLMVEIRAYNEIDCRVMADVLGYFRRQR